MAGDIQERDDRDSLPFPKHPMTIRRGFQHIRIELRFCLFHYSRTVHRAELIIARNGTYIELHNLPV